MSYLTNKTFTDLYNLDAVKRLYANFDSINLNFDENDPKKNKNSQKKYLARLMLSKPTNYHFASGKKSGRLYGSNLQFLKRELRNAICKEYYVDVDMKNSSPTILLWWCQKNTIHTPILKEYCLNRSKYYHLKQDINVIMNGGAVDKSVSVDDFDFLNGFKVEISKIHKQMIEKVENVKIINTLKKSKKENLEGRLCYEIIEKYESDIIESAVKFLEERGLPIEFIILMFDGFLLPVELFTQELLNDLNEEIFKQTTIPVDFIKKEMTDCFAIPADWEYDKKEIVKKQNYEKYLLQKKDFELKFQKIISAGLFLQFENNEINYFSETKLKISYKHLPGKFIDCWITDPYMKLYDTMGVYPKNCPDNAFNLWLPFDAELNESVGDDLEAVEFFKSHIKILCNRDPKITTLIINWLAQMLQYPEIKTFIPAFISKQGAGKGTIFEIMGKILGAKRVFDTAIPSQYVWGEFNNAMEQAFFICLDELSKKEMGECDGRFKKLITDPTIRINNKGVNSFTIKSYHRFMICSNNEDPIKTSEDDRRNLIIRCSDELCDKDINKEYWKRMRKLIDDPNAIKSIYNYLMDIPDLEYFHLTKLPKTEYHQDILDKNESVEQSFIKSLAFNTNTIETKTYRADELIIRFNDYIKSVGKKEYNIDASTLMLRLKNLDIPGVSKKKTKACNLTVIDFEQLKKHFEVPLECNIEEKFETDF
jgi:hypothetical protein